MESQKLGQIWVTHLSWNRGETVAKHRTEDELRFCGRPVRCWKIPAVRRHVWYINKNKKWTMVRCWVLRYEESINSPFDCSLQDDTVVSHEFSGVIDCVELSNDIYIYNPHLYLYLYRCHNTMFIIDHCLPAIGWGMMGLVLTNVSGYIVELEDASQKKGEEQLGTECDLIPATIWNCGFLGISGVKFETPPINILGFLLGVFTFRSGLKSWRHVLESAGNPSQCQDLAELCCVWHAELHAKGQCGKPDQKPFQWPKILGSRGYNTTNWEWFIIGLTTLMM